MNNNTLSDKDRNSVGVMLVQLAQKIRSDSEYADNSSMQDIADRLFTSFNALMGGDAAFLQSNYDVLRQLSVFDNVMVTEEDRERFKPREDGRTYIVLPQMPHEQFMQYVEHLKAIGAKYDREVKQWYVEADWQMPETDKIMSNSSESRFEKKDDKESGIMNELDLKTNLKEVAESIKDMDTVIGKAQALLEYAEHDRDLFSYAERNLVVNYAYKTNDLDKTIDLMDRLVNAEDQSKRHEIVSAAENEIDKINEKYKAIYYDGPERKELFAESKELLFQDIKEYGEELKDNARCYIQAYDVESGEYQQEGIYLISSGRDVTPVEIKLPHMSPETFKEVKDELKNMGVKYNGEKRMWYVERSTPQDTMDKIQNCLDSHDENIYLKLPSTSPEKFKNIVEQLKRDGAKYNPVKKAWYITEKNAQSKFSEYLSSDKPSVHGKLEQYKEAAAENNQGKESAMEPRNKDVQERA